jgi:hypothetical protein
MTGMGKIFLERKLLLNWRQNRGFASETSQSLIACDVGSSFPIIFRVAHPILP